LQYDLKSPNIFLKDSAFAEEAKKAKEQEDMTRRRRESLVIPKLENWIDYAHKGGKSLEESVKVKDARTAQSNYDF